MRVFVDSDVIISSLLSESGAAHLLLDIASGELFISSLSEKEMKKVVERLGIERVRLDNLIKNKFEMVKFSESARTITRTFKNYVLDQNDAHIAAGAKKAKAKFLITYNIKDFKIEKIRKDLDIIVLTPGKFLQYLRSLG